MIPFNWPVIVTAGAVATAIVGFGGGWHLRGIVAENEALRTEQAALRALAEARENAQRAAADYAAARDALQPQVRVVRVQADPIVRELVSCPLPVDADRLLDRAADLADSAAAGSADAPGAASGAGTGKAGVGR